MRTKVEPTWPALPADDDLVVCVVIPGEPVAKARPRTTSAEFTTVGGHRVRTRKAHTYTPDKTSQAELLIGWALREARVKLNSTDELTVRLVFHSKDTKRRDTDNLIKTVLDAANHIVWADDSQVTRILADLERGSLDPRTEMAVYVRRPLSVGKSTTRNGLQ